MKKLIVAILLVSLVLSCTGQKPLSFDKQPNKSEWTEVKAEKANFSVQCPQKEGTVAENSVKYNDVTGSASLFCESDGISFFVHASEWNVSENPEENSDRYFKSLISRGEFSDLKEIELNHEGKKGVEGQAPNFKSMGQYFLIDKTAYLLSVTFKDGFQQIDAKNKLDDRRIETARRFFDSFKLLRK